MLREPPTFIRTRLTHSVQLTHSLSMRIQYNSVSPTGQVGFSSHTVSQEERCPGPVPFHFRLVRDCFAGSAVYV